MEKELNFNQAPHLYALCLNRQCPKAESCFRQLLERVVPTDVEYLRVISPKHLTDITGECPYYRPYGKVRYAKGFVSALNNLPHKTMQSVVFHLMSHFGRRTYYRVRKGERLLSNDEQQYIQNVFKQYGDGNMIQFDAYEEDFNW